MRTSSSALGVVNGRRATPPGPCGALAIRLRGCMGRGNGVGSGAVARQHSEGVQCMRPLTAHLQWKSRAGSTYEGASPAPSALNVHMRTCVAALRSPRRAGAAAKRSVDAAAMRYARPSFSNVAMGPSRPLPRPGTPAGATPNDGAGPRSPADGGDTAGPGTSAGTANEAGAPSGASAVSGDPPSEVNAASGDKSQSVEGGLRALRGLNMQQLRERSQELQAKLRDVVKNPPKLFYGSMNLKQVLTALTYRTVMLFLIIGAFLSWMLTAWARGSDLKLSDPYSFTVTFPLAPSLDKGVALKLKGVQIGTVRSARSGLSLVEATVEVNTKTTRIPRTSRLVYNKAGPLSPTPCIDVQVPATDGDPASAATPVTAANAANANPDDVDACRREGVLLCAGDRVTGHQGGGMDELTGLVIKSMRRGVDDSSVLPPIMRQMSTEQTAVATSAMRPRR
mmetsp:Transcript_45038/g.134420  ORF Transcript_45038/g.134420 Transcript_45038/m.134420 type:complete len:452 (-) Transcript_45038:263-1618(-)